MVQRVICVKNVKHGFHPSPDFNVKETEAPRVEEIYLWVIRPVSPSGAGSSVGVAAPGFWWECISVPGRTGILSGRGAGLRSRSQWREGERPGLNMAAGSSSLMHMCAHIYFIYNLAHALLNFIYFNYLQIITCSLPLWFRW